MERATQKQLTELFGKSQSWISRRQTDDHDPMPRDLAGAEAWGKRRQLIGQASSAPAGELPATAAADVRLKNAREQKLLLETGQLSGQLVSLADVEAREQTQAAEFRRVACEMPRRARVIIERHVQDAAVSAAIYADLEPLAAELLNAADPLQALRGLSIDDARVVLLARVEELLKCL